MHHQYEVEILAIANNGNKIRTSYTVTADDPDDAYYQATELADEKCKENTGGCIDEVLPENVEILNIYPSDIDYWTDEIKDRRIHKRR